MARVMVAQRHQIGLRLEAIPCSPGPDAGGHQVHHHRCRHRRDAEPDDAVTDDEAEGTKEDGARLVGVEERHGLEEAAEGATRYGEIRKTAIGDVGALQDGDDGGEEERQRAIGHEEVHASTSYAVRGVCQIGRHNARPDEQAGAPEVCEGGREP